ncbi:hypothetical protein GCM10009629_35390 [Pseudonocardia alni]
MLVSALWCPEEPSRGVHPLCSTSHVPSAEFISAAAEHGQGAAGVSVVLLRAQIQMVGQRLVFLLFRTAPDKQNEWLMAELRARRGRGRPAVSRLRKPPRRTSRDGP